MQHIFIGKQAGRYINVAQIAWIEIAPGGKSITLYMSVPGPDGKSDVTISDPQNVKNVAMRLGLP